MVEQDRSKSGTGGNDCLRVGMIIKGKDGFILFSLSEVD